MDLDINIANAKDAYKTYFQQWLYRNLADADEFLSDIGYGPASSSDCKDAWSNRLYSYQADYLTKYLGVYQDAGKIKNDFKKEKQEYSLDAPSEELDDFLSGFSIRMTGGDE